MKEKLTVVILFGGQSSEHDVSCKSAVTIINSLNTDKYNPVLIGITKEGRWLLTGSADQITDGTWRISGTPAILSPDACDQCVLIWDSGQIRKLPVDVIFPVLHGMYGEDGTVQGLFELSQIPYVGCGVLASAVSMDKLYTKIIVDTLGIRQARYVGIPVSDLKDMDTVVSNVEAELAYPVFVKPSKSGSSQGVSKAADQKELIQALNLAAKHDSKILVEETIAGREIECAVLGYGSTTQASGVGEILAAEAFYSYDAKYNNPQSQTVISPDLPSQTTAKLQEYAVRIFQAVDGFGLSRVDFFVEHSTGEIVFNEINTLPGFTSISMYPMLFRACGLDTDQLVDELIALAMERRK